MKIEPAELTPRENYKLLTSIVVPRPIAWVSSLSPDGTRNLAPHSYFNIISTDPPIVHFTSAGEKDTRRNVEATGEFVVNIVTDDLVEPMNVTAARFDADDDEFAWADLEVAASSRVAPPRVAAAKAAIECRYRETVSMGNGHMLFGEVVTVHLSDAVHHDGVADPEKYRPVARLGGTAYATIRDVYHLARPDVEELQRDAAR
jgi:flavin reductase (DIM6/NTAB) family NADH-FMN oxidoreductase RutF